MADTPEAKMKKKVDKVLKEAGVWYFAPQSGIYGRSGIPDRIACVNGRMIGIEVKAAGGIAYKFTSPAHRGVADRVVCLPDGSTWFVELKAPGGRLSELQKIFQSDMARLRQNYACLRSKDHVDEWVKEQA